MNKRANKHKQNDSSKDRKPSSDKRAQQRLSGQISKTISKLHALVKKKHPKSGGSLMVAFQSDRGNILAWGSKGMRHFLRKGLKCAFRQSQIEASEFKSRTYVSPHECFQLLSKQEKLKLYTLIRCLDRHRMQTFRLALGIGREDSAEDDQIQDSEPSTGVQSAPDEQIEGARHTGEVQDAQSSTDQGHNERFSASQKQKIFQQAPSRLNVKQLEQAIVVTLEVLDPGVAANQASFLM